MADRHVVDITDADALGAELIGGKAVGLAAMTDLGLRVPPAFVITAEVGRAVLAGTPLDDDISAAIDAALERLEHATGRRLDDAIDPLSVSVRSGAAVSMPGMMDTLLDVHGGPPAIRAAVTEVFGSWNTSRARAYRQHNGIADGLGTAVVVQAMVFGDRGSASGSGVAFSRDPDSGEPGMSGDYLAGSRGTDVVSGSGAPLPVEVLADRMPAVAEELAGGLHLLERHRADMVEVEFTVEDGVLHFLQCRRGSRSAGAAVRIAVDLADEGLISHEVAVARVTPDQRRLATRSTVAPGAGAPLTTGLGACAGVATGAICCSSGLVDDLAVEHSSVILVRSETSPADIQGMIAASGLLTSRGGLVSHAALVARELDLPAVVGAAGMEVDEDAGRVRIGSVDLATGDIITIDGATGEVHLGEVPTRQPAPDAHLARLTSWSTPS